MVVGGGKTFHGGLPPYSDGDFSWSSGHVSPRILRLLILGIEPSLVSFPFPARTTMRIPHTHTHTSAHIRTYAHIHAHIHTYPPSTATHTSHSPSLSPHMSGRTLPPLVLTCAVKRARSGAILTPPHTLGNTSTLPLPAPISGASRCMLRAKAPPFVRTAQPTILCSKVVDQPLFVLRSLIGCASVRRLLIGC